MSQNWYFKNMDKNEYVHSSGNGNFRDTLAHDNPRFIIWVMMKRWAGCVIKCFPEREMPNGYKDILDAVDRTEQYRKEYAEN